MTTTASWYAQLGRPARAGLWALGSAAVVVAVCLGAMALRTLPAVQGFVEAYPGVTEAALRAPVGTPGWVGWQHGLNVFFLALIVRTGLQVRTTTRPAAYWSRRPGGKRISLPLWLHLAVDVLWVVNGVVFVVLLAVSGRWLRIVPWGSDAIPSAVSVAIQYASLHWPHEDGWIAYNALQQFTYAGVIFVLAPLAILSGIRMSPLWPRTWDRWYPIKVARAVHFPVMLTFVAFVAVHVVLVLATGAVGNLNHMYSGKDGTGWAGLIVFAVSAAVTAAACVLATPPVIRSLAALTGTVSR